MKTLFKETQRFTQWWLLLILCCIAIIPIYSIITRLSDNTPFMTNPSEDWFIIIFSLFVFLIAFLFFKIKLITIIDKDEIKIIFKPFAIKVIKWSDIKTAKIIDYGFVGGWGIRIGSKYGTVYNTNGNIGLAITTKSGNRLIVGTQRKNDLKKSLKIL